MEQNKEFYTLKEVSEITDLSSDLIRTYQKEFNIQVERSEGGHRRFTKENIELLISIKKKVKEQNWSYKQIRSWLNGEVSTEILKDVQVQSNLEKKMDLMLEEMKNLKEENQFLKQAFVKLTEEIGKVKLSQENQEQLLIEAKERAEKTDSFISDWRTNRPEKKTGLVGWVQNKLGIN